jgi:hypothetical protein
MAILGVSDLWKMFEWTYGRLTGSEIERRKRVEAWLDAVYADLKQISDIWLEIVKEKRISQSQADAVVRIVKGTNSSTAQLVQTIFGTRLEQFYDAASTVLPPENPFRETFIHTLASILLMRARTRTKLEQLTGTWEINPQMIAELEAGALELQKQVAILQAQITTFKASP